MKPSNRMTKFAAVRIGRRSELAVVDVAMAIQAPCIANLEDRGLAGRHMTLGARYLGVQAFKRIFGCRVFLHAKRRRNEPLDGMTGFACITAGALQELSAVGIIAPVA